MEFENNVQVAPSIAGRANHTHKNWGHKKTTGLTGVDSVYELFKTRQQISHNKSGCKDFFSQVCSVNYSAFLHL